MNNQFKEKYGNINKFEKAVATILVVASLISGGRVIMSNERLQNVAFAAKAEKEEFIENREKEKKEEEKKNAEEAKASSKHSIKVPKDCKTSGVMKPVTGEVMKDITYKALEDNGVKIEAQGGGHDHELLEKEAGYKKKTAVLDTVKDKIGRTGINLLNPLDVRQKSGLNVEQLKKATPEKLKEIVPTIIEAEKGDKPINAVFLMSICMLESKNGTSELCVSKNNVAGLNARDSDKGTAAYGDTYATKSESAKTLVSKIRDEYVYSDTDFRANGSAIADINKKYCSQTTWTYKLLIKAMEIEKAIKL